MPRSLNTAPEKTQRTESARRELARRIAARFRGEGEEATDVTGFSLYRRSAPTPCLSATYMPRFVLFVQGEKRVTLGKTTYVCGPELLDACTRLVDLLDTPEDIAFLSRLIQRDIIYRLLRSPQGAHLSAIATLGEQSNRTARVVAWLRANYAHPLRVEELAEMAQMGVSTLHHHFRTLTAMSPLQYQKQLRLHTARERMLAEGLDAAGAAYAVGYESASQFNREYSRFFGQPPMRDIKARLLAGATASAATL